MTTLRRLVPCMLLLTLAATGLVACGNETPEPAAPGATAEPDAPVAEAADGIAAVTAPDDTGFDVESVPVSTVALGDFPYFSLPAGYVDRDANGTVLDFARAPVWTGDRLEWVEGRIFQNRLAADSGKTFSALEIARNLDHMVREAGGVKVTEGQIPADVRDTIPDATRMELLDGLGDIYNYPAHVWLLRRADRDIWVHMCAHTAGGAWMVVESLPFEPTAQLLPASELRSGLDQDGRVAVEINFESDSAAIVAESQAQIDQILALLQEDPSIRLSIEGHTDNTGDAAHNRRLSERRAAAVVAELSRRGIDAARLASAGFGADRPVASNDSAAGKRSNRRVELVKI